MKKKVSRLTAVLLCVAIAVCMGAPAFAQGGEVPNVSGAKVNDVEKAFAALSTKGVEGNSPDNKGFPNDTIVVNSNHIQGVAVYGDFTIVTVNGHRSKTNHGYVLIYNSKGVIQQIDTPVPEGGELTHTGGMQVCGDLLAVPLSGASGTVVAFYDLSGLKSGGKAELYQQLNARDVGGFGSGSAALSSFVGSDGKLKLALADSGANLFLADVPEKGGEFVFKRVNLTRNTQPSEFDSAKGNNCMLIADSQNRLYYIAASSPQSGAGIVSELIGEGGIDYRDALMLYRYDFNSSGDAVLNGPLMEKEVSPFDNYLLALGSHVRFTCTLRVENDDYFSVISTPSLPGNLATNIVGEGVSDVLDFLFGSKLNVNEYRPETVVTIRNVTTSAVKVTVLYTCPDGLRSLPTQTLPVGGSKNFEVPADASRAVPVVVNSNTTPVSLGYINSLDGEHKQYNLVGTSTAAVLLPGLSDTEPLPDIPYLQTALTVIVRLVRLVSSMIGSLA